MGGQGSSLVIEYLSRLIGDRYFTRKMSFVKPEFWDDLVSKSICVESYKGIVIAMFKDMVVNEARLFVLEEYTRSVGERYPDNAYDVWTEYYNFKNNVFKM